MPFGQGLPPGSGAAAIQSAIQRRQAGGESTIPIGGQITGGSPIGQNIPKPPTLGGAPAPSAPAPSSAEAPPKLSDTEIILKALTEKLKSESKIKEVQAGV